MGFHFNVVRSPKAAHVRAAVDQLHKGTPIYPSHLLAVIAIALEHGATEPRGASG